MAEESVTVKEGDTLVSIAHERGFRSWEVIYLHPKNEELRKKRPNPEQLLPGDVVVVPEKKPKEFTLEVNKRHELVVKTLKAHLRLTVGDEDGPFAGARFSVQAGGRLVEGTTDDQGMIHVLVPAGAKEGTLRVWPVGRSTSVDWELQLGHLAPAPEEAGYKARLVNLGYGPVDTPDALKQALLSLQGDHGLEPTGTLDEPTRNKIDALTR